MTEPDADACRPVEIDGEIIRVRGSGDMSDESRAALAEVIRAAKRRYAAEHPARLTVDTINSDQLDALQDRADRAEGLLRRYVSLADVTHKYRAMGGHDSLGANLTCAGCALRDEIRAALDEPKEPTT